MTLHLYFARQYMTVLLRVVLFAATLVFVFVALESLRRSGTETSIILFALKSAAQKDTRPCLGIHAHHRHGFRDLVLWTNDKLQSVCCVQGGRDVGSRVPRRANRLRRACRPFGNTVPEPRHRINIWQTDNVGDKQH